MNIPDVERERLRTALVTALVNLAWHIERGDRRGAHSLALEALREHDPTYTDTAEDNF